MIDNDDLIRACEAFAKARNVSEARASTIIFGQGLVIRRLRAGADIQLRRCNRAMQYLSDNWPRGTPWPKGVPRPRKSA